ncbi:MAG: hypothetical protein ABI207_01935 [Crocinitomicaceae bacterium]
MKKIALYISVGFVIAACSPSFIIPTQADADRVQTQFPGATVASLAEGKTLMENNCAKCHHLMKPKSQTEEQWNHIVPIMAKKAKLNSEDEAKVLQYILTSKPVKK